MDNRSLRQAAASTRGRPTVRATKVVRGASEIVTDLRKLEKMLMKVRKALLKKDSYTAVSNAKAPMQAAHDEVQSLIKKYKAQ